MPRPTKKRRILESDSHSDDAITEAVESLDEDDLPTCYVVADDFGVSLPRNRGIIRAMKDGVVTHTSIMANGLAVDDAIALAREHKVLDRLGLHLNLTEGAPLLGDQVPSLCGPTTGVMRGKRDFRAACDARIVHVEEAAAEAAAQLRWFRERVGRPAARVDGHQHCHVHPALCAALAATFATAGVTSTRVPVEDCPNGALCALCSKVSSEAMKAAEVFAAAGVAAVPRSTAFVGLSLCGGGYSVGQFVGAVRAQVVARRGVRAVEVMVHPGYSGGEWDAFDASNEREDEMRVLCDPRLATALGRIVSLYAPGKGADLALP